MTENQANQGKTARQDANANLQTPRIIVQADVYYSVMEDDSERPSFKIINDAAQSGYNELLKENGTAVDAVEAAVSALEGSEKFNAGYGSLLNMDGEVECDAMIMDGHTMKTGAIIAGRHFRNPVSISRKIMEESEHCAFTGEGAKRFADEISFPTCEPSALISEKALEIHRRIPRPTPIRLFTQQSHDTVAAIAMDAKGHFACATSTGGLPGKRKGRVGDAPLVGCGGYANKCGAAASSGHGEAIIKMTLAREVVHNMENGKNAQESAEMALKTMVESVEEGYGCATAIDKEGNFGLATNSAVLIWASVKDGKLESGIKKVKDLNASNE